MGKILKTFEQFVQDQNLSASETMSEIDEITRNAGTDELEKYKDIDMNAKPKKINYKMPGSEKIKKKKEDEE